MGLKDFLSVSGSTNASGKTTEDSGAVDNNISKTSPDRIIKPSVTLIEWTAPERHFTKRNKEFYRKIAVIIIFFMMMLVIIKDFLVILILGVIFGAVYVFTSTPPSDVTHKITTNGIDFASKHMYTWDTLISFYIQKDTKPKTLVVNTKDTLPGRLLLLVPDDLNSGELEKTINEYLSIIEKPEKDVYREIMTKISRKLNI